jgi:hypothetical protein
MAWVQVLLLVLLAVSTSGCELAGGIFKAGAWVGAVAVIFVVGIVAFFAARLRG